MSNLNRIIAEARGYRIQCLETKDFAGGTEYHVELLDPDGLIVHSAWYRSPDDFACVFNHAVEIGKLTGHYYEYDLNAAIHLLEEMHGELVYFPTTDSSKPWTCGYNNDEIDAEVPGLTITRALEIDAETPCLAICRAWCAWKGIALPDEDRVHNKTKE